VYHACAGGQRRQRCAAGVSKQVKHLNLPPAIRYGLADVFPVDSLLGEHADVLKAGRAYGELKPACANRPLLRHFFQITPASAAGIAAVVYRVRLPKLRLCALPDRLRVGPLQNDASHVLQLLAAARIQQGVISRFICNPHGNPPIRTTIPSEAGKEKPGDAYTN
jgi:hypothetical protein